MRHQLPELPYDYNALEPHIDAQTMEIHHSKHHQGYVNKFNAAIEGSPAENRSIEEILNSVSEYSTAIRNNGGGHYNHSLFWSILTPGGKELDTHSELSTDIIKTFGTISNFKNEFAAAAASRFGSGWAWLIVNHDGNLEVTSTPNQDNPLMDVAGAKGTPILGLDVWEHAYYLNYQNRRPDYINSFWDVVNWEAVEKNYEQIHTTTNQEG